MNAQSNGQTKTKPDVIITDEGTYDAAKVGKATLMSWPEFAAGLFSQLQDQHPELAQYTLEQFIEACPYKFEIVADEDSATENNTGEGHP